MAVFAVGLAWLLRRRALPIDIPPRLAMLAISVAVTLYIIRVGGDPRHHRYMIFAFCLAASSMAGLGGWLVSAFLPRTRPAILATVAIIVALDFGILHPPQLSAHPLNPGVRHRRAMLINDAALHRGNPERQPPAWSLEPLGFAQDSKLLAARDDFRSGYPGTNTVLGCSYHYWHIHERAIHGAGLTDAVLARMEMPRRTIRMTAHNPDLKPLAKDISRIHQHEPGYVGMYRHAVEGGSAPDWVAPNLESLELIERKIYNEHRFFENLRLALTPVPALQMDPYLSPAVAPSR
jgi:hypothetical protein